VPDAWDHDAVAGIEDDLTVVESERHLTAEDDVVVEGVGPVEVVGGSRVQVEDRPPGRGGRQADVERLLVGPSTGHGDLRRRVLGRPDAVDVHARRTQRHATLDVAYLGDSRSAVVSDADDHEAHRLPDHSCALGGQGYNSAAPRHRDGDSARALRAVRGSGA
jgi:hypothetical protein